MHDSTCSHKKVFSTHREMSPTQENVLYLVTMVTYSYAQVKNYCSSLSHTTFNNCILYSDSVTKYLHTLIANIYIIPFILHKVFCMYIFCVLLYIRIENCIDLYCGLQLFLESYITHNPICIVCHGQPINQYNICMLQNKQMWLSKAL